MVARQPASNARDDARGRARGVRAETPPTDYWRRWDDISEQIGGVRPQFEERQAAVPAPAPVQAPVVTPPAVAPLASTPTPPPAEQRAATASPPVATAPGDDQLLRPTDSPYRILIVEDDRSQALFAQSVLHGAGMHAQVEMSAAAVPQAIAEYRPDLILMDLHMPDLDGIRLTTLIRQQPQHQLLPIVFLTGDPDPERQFEVLDSGADDFLNKPIRPRHLIAAVSNRIRRARQQAQLSGGEDGARSNPETGLPTRVHVMQLLGNHLGRADAGILFIEVASALGLRERYGYAAFERLMNQAGHRLARAATPFPLARLNDNSFLVLVEGLDVAAQRHLAVEMRAQLATQAFEVREGESVHLRCAIGVTPLDHGFGEAGSALEAAERTALQARLEPEGVRVHMPSEVQDDAHLELVDGQLELAYQPIVAVAGGDMAQYQVLLRLRRPDGTLLQAGQVIPAAEAAGRIADLDQQVLDHALGLLQHYQHASPPLRLFVSQSARTLAREAFAEWLEQSLAQRGVAGTSLVIDVRLDDALIHTVTLQQFCKRMMAHGVQFCLSQFETGEENNALLSQLPLGFVRMHSRYAAAHAQPALRDELRDAINLAHRHGLLIIGQQIEDAQAAAAMWMGGVDLIQGNLVQSVGKELDFDFHSAVL
ncbi:response regulator receiver protein [Stenotrophomonas panacihumi]|uniref:Response regulator receiver protein n=1 Tax=Stenotrophomonas panacihumi TaxID=676599 RepID=A0A0R0A5G2_9GAMM|nr:EAL domain-containing protein [Stenotrophomonas panacihumi]KRG37762.1 response regulator receiver protein [Stenotrophomonas panacihumi]PTN56286.1 response regulator receiver protein [Stenotrophomonas panacihumi]